MDLSVRVPDRDTRMVSGFSTIHRCRRFVRVLSPPNWCDSSMMMMVGRMRSKMFEWFMWEMMDIDTISGVVYR